MAPRLLVSCAVAVALALAGPSQQLPISANEEKAAMTPNPPSLRASAPQAMVEAKAAAERKVVLPPEASAKKMKPCHVSSDWNACGTRGLPHEYPGGLHCPADQCCSKTAVKLGYGGGGWCTSSWALCSSKVVYHEEFSYGTCTCKTYGRNCPPNSTCQENEGRPYCKCNDGFVFHKNQCIKGKRGARPTVSPSLDVPHEEDEEEEDLAESEPEEDLSVGCQAGDCRPGSCEYVDGRVKCTCGPGFKSALLTDTREQCVKEEGA